MIRVLPRSPRGTWLLAVAVWLAGCAAFWWVLPYRPRASWPTEEPAVVHGFVPGTAVVLTSMPWSSTIDGPPGPMLGPLVARDAATGQVREWFPDNERLALVDPGVDGKHVLIGRVIDGRARLFLHDAADGKVIAELPRGGPRAENENDQPADAYEQFAAFRPDGRQVVYADRDGEQRWLRVWDLKMQQEVAAISNAEPPAAWSPDGGMLAFVERISGRNGWVVRLRDKDLKAPRTPGFSPQVNRKPSRVVIAPDGRSVVAVLEWIGQVVGREPPPELVVWDTTSGKELYRRDIVRAAFPMGVPWFVVEEFWDPPKTKCVRRLDFATGAERDHITLRSDDQDWESLSPDGRLVFGITQFQSPVAEWLHLHVLKRPPEDFESVHAQLWETGCGRLRYSFNAHFGTPPRQSAWPPDGALIAVAGKDTLSVWDVPLRRPLTWFAAGAALFGVPPFVIARRQVRRHRKEAAT
jgi:WD40 repeat protein